MQKRAEEVAVEQAAENGGAERPLPPTRGPRYAPEWEGGEHTFIGNVIELEFPSGGVVAGKRPLKLANGLALTYGQILALGGDFYGLPKTPICEDKNPPTLFLKAFETLSKGTKKETEEILAVMQIEINAVNEAVRRGRPASSAYAELGDTLSEKWNRITGGGSPVTAFYPLGRYLELASTNWDHFCPWAWETYEMGHAAAVSQAIAAAAQSDPAKQLAGLELAYAMNAFADHYLSDMFSAGHMRTPRKQLYETVTPSVAGSYCSRYMHDEDCAFGLKVENEAGDNWTAYGDKRFFDPANGRNKDICVQAIKASAADIYASFQSRKPPTPPGPQRYVPKFEELTKNPTNSENPAAMFIAESRGVERRSNLGARTAYKWTWWWNAIATLNELFWLPEFSGGAIPPFSLSGSLLVLRKTASGGNFGIDLLGPTAKGFEKLWSSAPEAFPMGGPIYFTSGDIEGDGNAQLVQLVGGSSFAATVFRPAISPKVPYEYERLAPLPFSSKWKPFRALVGDFNNDGIDELCIPCACPSGKLGVILAALKGGTLTLLCESEVSIPSKKVSTIQIGDLDGDGSDEILMGWENGSQLSVSIYKWNAAGHELTEKDAGPFAVPPQGDFLVGDVDGDGRAELVFHPILSQGKAEPTYVFHYDPQYGVVLDGDASIKGGTWWIGDLDGDGKSEVLALWGTPAFVEGSVWSDDGDGGLEERWQTPRFTQHSPIGVATIHLGPNFGAQLAWMGGEATITLYLFAWQAGAMKCVGEWKGLGPTNGVFGLFAVPLGTGVPPDLASSGE